MREFANLKKLPKEADKIERRSIHDQAARMTDSTSSRHPVRYCWKWVNAAELKDGMSVLEPSAGMGHIAEQIRESGVEPDVVEFNGDRRL